jgi:predicted nucleic acid-binding protein
MVLRRVVATDPQYPLVKSCLDSLMAEGHDLLVTPQVLVEFHAVATRPVTANGLGMSCGEALLQVEEIAQLFELLPESPGIFEEWKRLTASVSACGRQSFDARLAAVTLSNNLDGLVTLNSDHFRRFKGLSLIDPSRPDLPATQKQVQSA